MKKIIFLIVSSIQKYEILCNISYKVNVLKIINNYNGFKLWREID